MDEDIKPTDGTDMGEEKEKEEGEEDEEEEGEVKEEGSEVA